MTSRLPSLKPKVVIKILEKAGFVFARQKGSHRIYIKGALGVIVPYHNRDLKKGTLKNIISQSSLSLTDFLKK